MSLLRRSRHQLKPERIYKRLSPSDCKNENSTTKDRLMKIASVIARVLLGLVFVVFGLNGFLHFIPMPPMQGQAGQFVGAMFNTGYIYVIAALQVIGGILLLLPGYVPLGLLLLGPVIVNILLSQTLSRTLSIRAAIEPAFNSLIHNSIKFATKFPITQGQQ
jgi:putative oxidoreductase